MSTLIEGVFFIMELPKTPGIYTITNLLNNKMYVGYCSSFNKRNRDHFRDLCSNNHDNAHLQNSFNKYGEENFIFEILEECEERFLVALEHYWATILRVHEEEFGYNMAPTHPERAVNFSKESIRLREATKRKKAEERGYWFTEEWKQKQRERNLGKKYSKETLEKRRETQRKIGYIPTPPSAKGRKLSQEHKAKLCCRNKRVKLTLQDNSVKEFDSMKECSAYLGKYSDYTRRCMQGIINNVNIKIEFI